MGLSASATMPWFTSKYESLKSTRSARLGRYETCPKWMSKSLSPGLKARPKAAWPTQSTWSGVKPSAAAMA